MTKDQTARAGRRFSHAARARMRVARLAARLPLFAYAGILDQVADSAYDATRVADEDFARALAADHARQRATRAGQHRRLAYLAMLTEAIGAQAAAEAEATYLAHWHDHTPMLHLAARLDHLCALVAHHTGRTPLAVFEEARLCVTCEEHEGQTA